MTGPVCLLYQDQFPWDVRVEKIAAAIAEAGTHIHIVSRNRNGLGNAETYRTNVSVQRVGSMTNAAIQHILGFPAFFSPMWLGKVIAVVRRTSARLIIVRDLPLSPLAWFVGKIVGIPVLLDMAENYPAMVQDTWTYRGPKPLDYIVRNPSLLRMLERWVLPRMNGILVVSAQSGRRIERLGVQRDRIYEVRNTPCLNGSGDEVKRDAPGTIRITGSPILTYTGGLEETRGLAVVLKAIVKVVAHEPRVSLVVAGTGTSEPMLKRLAEQLGIEKHIFWLGWQNHGVIPGIIRAGDIGLVPHYVTAHTNETVPNKLFDYMLQRRPVIVTHAESLKEIVEGSRCGLVYKDTDPDHLAEAILKLRDKKLREEFGESGYRAVLENYNWNQDKQRLREAVRRVSEMEC